MTQKVDNPQMQFADRIVDVLVMTQTLTVENPQMQLAGRIMDVPVLTQRLAFEDPQMQIADRSAGRRRTSLKKSSRGSKFAEKVGMSVTVSDVNCGDCPLARGTVLRAELLLLLLLCAACYSSVCVSRRASQMSSAVLIFFFFLKH